ncbi:MAG: hypothetical protein J0H06_03015 [Actinobacteria bacterium]|nr:hypothetical protein [Actinomycetota bacterium]OJU81879.1 MAG: hypothetical protein BGO11_10085 [Solirubrobacterales bacterium 70-9]
MEVVYGLILLAVIAFFVARPLLRPLAAGGAAHSRADELQILKESKYRELRDTELDHAAGKLSEEDYRARQDELRRESIAILAELELSQMHEARPI